MTKGKRNLKKQWTRYFRACSGFLPRRLRHYFFRQLIHLPQKSSNKIQFKLATSKEELEQAFSLLYKAYVAEGFQKPHSSQLRITPYHALPSTSTLVACMGSEVIGTLTLIADSSFGLPCDKVVDLSHFRKKNQRLVEVSSLAIQPQFRGELLLPLLKFMYEYCIKYYCADILIATLAAQTHAHELYESILSFKPLAKKTEELYSFANDVSVVVEALDLKEANDLFANLYLDKKKEKNLFDYFTKQADPRFNFPLKNYYDIDDPVMNPELINYFFNKTTKLFDELSQLELKKLYQIFPNEEYRKLLPKIKGKEFIPIRPPNSHRYNVRCPAQLKLNTQEQVIFTVTEVSRYGFKAVFENIQIPQKSFYCRVRIGEFEVSEVFCKYVWNNAENNYGFKILNKTSSNWDDFINYLDERFEQNTNSFKKVA